MPAYYLEALTVTLGIILLMAEAFTQKTNKSTIGVIAIVGLLGILAATFFATCPCCKPDAAWAKWPLWNFYQFDQLAIFGKAFALICTILITALSLNYRRILARFTDRPNSEDGTGEFYVLPIFACAGIMWMASARDFIGAFAALELLTITFYILVTFLRRNVGSLEAGVKYLILGALSTGFLVYGIAWIYGATGSMKFENLAHITSNGSPTFLLFGVALVMISLCFKIGAVPMQIWIPDVYQGAPTPTTAFLSVGSKAAGFFLLIRFLQPLLADASPVRTQVLTLLVVLAMATLLYGNWAAIAQTNFKRLLAYSSIAHAGFLLLALAAWKSHSNAQHISSISAVLFYLATYLIMTLGAFFILAQVRLATGGEEIENFNGLGKRSPILATALTLFLASLAGIPLTAGFWGKFFVFSLAIHSGLSFALAVAVISAAAGFYYYFKTIRAMWWQNPNDEQAIYAPTSTYFVVALLSIATIVIGFYPAILKSFC